MRLKIAWPPLTWVWIPLLTDGLAGPTESWLHRSARLTEFESIKTCVRRLERTSREQLVLENETQHVFETMHADISRIKQSIGVLSHAVDEELVVVRKECGDLKEQARSVARRVPAQAEPCATRRLPQFDTAVERTKNRDTSVQNRFEEVHKRDIERVEQALQTLRDQVNDAATRRAHQRGEAPVQRECRRSAAGREDGCGDAGDENVAHAAG
jgi:exonuclease VII large subunit